MQTIPHAVVIGKFYPFHKGHYFLLHSASTIAKKVTVVVMVDTKRETMFPFKKRAVFVRNGISRYSPFGKLKNIEVVPVYHTLETNYESDETWQGFADITNEGILKSRFKEKATHLIATDTSYSERLAKMLGLACVDLSEDRTLYPISATMIRNNPYDHWDYLNADVKLQFTQRIVILGPESTGTTTLAKDLTKKIRELGGIYYQSQWIGEYAREYIQNKLKLNQTTIKNLTITSKEIEFFAKKQLIQENRTVELTGCPVIVCDTDSLASQVWHKRYVGVYSKMIERIIAQQEERVLYVLTSKEGIPLEYDGTRDGDETIREEMQKEFEEQLKKRKQPYLIVKGKQEERVNQVLKRMGWKK